MGKVATSGIAARERARQARLVLDAAREVRDRRVEDAVTRVFLAQDRIADAATALAQVHTVHDTAVRDEHALIGAALRELTGDGIRPGQLATLIGISAADIRRLLTAGSEPAAAGSATKSASPVQSAGPASSVRPVVAS